MAGSATSALSVRYSSGMSRSPASCVCRYLRYLSTRAIEAVAMHACNIGSSESRNEVVAVADIQLGRARHSFTAAWLFVADAGRPLRRIRGIRIVLLSSFKLIYRSLPFASFHFHSLSLSLPQLRRTLLFTSRCHFPALAAAGPSRPPQGFYHVQVCSRLCFPLCARDRSAHPGRWFRLHRRRRVREWWQRDRVSKVGRAMKHPHRYG